MVQTGLPSRGITPDPWNSKEHWNQSGALLNHLVYNSKKTWKSQNKSKWFAWNRGRQNGDFVLDYFSQGILWWVKPRELGTVSCSFMEGPMSLILRRGSYPLLPISICSADLLHRAFMHKALYRRPDEHTGGKAMCSIPIPVSRI